MAEARVSVDQFSVDHFSCPVCLDLLKDPVTVPCGHSFCKVCINGCWDQEDESGVYSCPQCRDTFTPRPVLRRNNMLNEVVEKLKKTKVQDDSPAYCYADATVQLEEEQMKFQQKIQEKQKKLQELKQTINTIELSAQTAVEDSEMIFTEMISFMEKKRSEVTELIRVREKTQLNQTKRLLNQLEKEITDLQRRLTELEQLLDTHDHIHFLQTLASGRLAPPSDRPDVNISVPQHLSFDGVRNSVSDLKQKLEEFCEKEFSEISAHAEITVQIISPSQPQSREEFLKYVCDLTLDPNTANFYLILSKDNKSVRRSDQVQMYPDHPERFDRWSQVLSKESVCGRCYWELEWSGGNEGVSISVSYKDISRKVHHIEGAFGHNDQSWSLRCSSSSLSFLHNNIRTNLIVQSSSRIGVYVDHSAGILSFYSVWDTMELLHRVHTTFTKPLYAGITLTWPSNVWLCV